MFQIRSVLWIRCLKNQPLCNRNLSISPRFSLQNRSTKSRFKNVMKLEPTNAEEVPLSYRRLIKPTIFAVAFSAGSFCEAALWQYEEMRLRAQKMMRSPKNWLEKFTSDSQVKAGEMRQFLNALYNSMSEGERVFAGIAFLNTLVFLAWRVNSLQNIMIRLFTSNPGSKAVCWPMVLSTFSHSSGVHLLVNMFVLQSFITSVIHSLGKEQFLAFYLSAGVFSSLLSYAFKIATAQTSVSLGASGAIMGVLAYTCSKNPETLLSIVFLPFITFKAALGIKMIMGLDFTGILLRWKIFDHAAHLGGALFGLFWCHYGNTYIWKNRGPFLQVWHDIRNKSDK